MSKIETFVVFLKLRLNEEEAKTQTTGSSSTNTGSKPKGKAAKKRALANKLAESEAVFDNAEEQLLFQVCCFDQHILFIRLFLGHDQRFPSFPIPRPF